MSSANEHIAKKWFDAFNAQDLVSLLVLYDDDATHYSPKLKLRMPQTNGFVSGKKALQSWWMDAFERLPSLHYTPTTLTADHNRVFIEYTRHVENEPDMPIAEVLEIKDGKIVASRVYHG